MRKITIPKEAIQLDEARDIYQSMMNLLDENDVDHMEIYENLVKKCVRYAEFRGQWPLLSTEKKLEIDSSRTSAHNSAITAFKMLSRIQGEQSAEWADKIDFDDRKRVGDMACYITLFCGLDSR